MDTNIKLKIYIVLSLIFLILGSSLTFLGIDNIINKQNLTIASEPTTIDGLVGYPSTVLINGIDFDKRVEKDVFTYNNESFYLTPDNFKFWHIDESEEYYPIESYKTRGSRLNLLNPPGNYIVEPSNELEYRNVKAKIILRSFYEHTWRGQEGTKHELIVPKPSEWNINQLGIAWASLYLHPDYTTLITNGIWNPDADGQYYDYLLGIQTPYVNYRQMLFIDRALLRTYYYNIYASDNLYDWIKIYTGRSQQNERTYSRQPLYNPVSLWLQNNPYPYSGFMPPTGEWQDPSWNDIEYVSIPSQYKNYMYFKIEITDIKLTNNIPMLHAPVYPEIGAITFNYSITKEKETIFDASLNSPKNNSWYQMSLFDEIPLELGGKGITNNIQNDPRIKNISFYINNDVNNKFTYLISNNNKLESPLILPPNKIITYGSAWKYQSELSIPSYVVSNPFFSKWGNEKTGNLINDSSYDINVSITTMDKKGIYDIGVVLDDGIKPKNNSEIIPKILHNPLSISFNSSSFDAITENYAKKNTYTERTNLFIDELNSSTYSQWEKEGSISLFENNMILINGNGRIKRNLIPYSININNDYRYSLELVFVPELYLYTTSLILSIKYQNEYVININLKPNMESFTFDGVSYYYIKNFDKNNINIYDLPKHGLIDSVSITLDGTVDTCYIDTIKIIKNEIKTAPTYTPKIINEKLIFDHNNFVEYDPQSSYLEYNNYYDIINFQLLKPRLTTKIDYQYSYLTFPKTYDYWLASDHYTLSLEFEYNSINNNVWKKVHSKYLSWNDYFAWSKKLSSSELDNYLLISFEFAGILENGQMGNTYTILLLIHGDPNISNNTQISSEDINSGKLWTSDSSALSKYNILQQFINDFQNSQPNVLYSDQYISDTNNVSIKSFESICDYFILSNNLDVFSSPLQRKDWILKKMYAIKNITFHSLNNKYRRIELEGIREGSKTWVLQNRLTSLPQQMDRKIYRYDIEFLKSSPSSDFNQYQIFGIVENIETLNDSIAIDNIRLYHIPKTGNLFSTFQIESKELKYYNYGMKDEQFTLNGIKNPKREITTRTNTLNAVDYYNKINKYYGKEIIIKIGTITINKFTTSNFVINISSFYHYLGTTLYNYSFDASKTYQLGTVTVKDIVFIPKNISSSVYNYTQNELMNYRYYNSLDPFYQSYYSDMDKSLGAATIIRNAFSDAYTQGYKRNFNLESTIKTTYYNENPKIGDYIEVTLNLPVSSHYDIYFRESTLYTSILDQNFYTISINGKIYRKYIQSMQTFSQNYIPSLVEYQSDLMNEKQLFVASNYFTAGKNIIRITFDSFNEYSYYDPITKKIITTKDMFSAFNFDQIILYYRSDSSYSIPVSEFLRTNPTSMIHSITTEINIKDEYVSQLGSKYQYTTYFGLEIKPLLNFKLGSVNEYLNEYFKETVATNYGMNEIYQLQYLNNLNNKMITAYVIDANLKLDSLKYRINNNGWKTWDKITTTNNFIYKLEKNNIFNGEQVKYGENIIEIYAENIRNQYSQAYLLFYYDNIKPTISILNTSLQLNEKISYNDTIHVNLYCEDNLEINQISYSTNLKTSQDNIYGSSFLKPNTITIFDKIINRTSTKNLNLSISISASEIEQGISSITFTIKDGANNINTTSFQVEKIAEFLGINFTTSKKRYIEENVSFYFNASNYILSGIDKEIKYTYPNTLQWIKFGYGDYNDVYDKIEHEFIATSQSLTKLKIAFQTQKKELYMYPALIEIKKGDTILSKSYVYPSVRSLEYFEIDPNMREIDIPDTFLELNEKYTISITPFKTPYNIMNIRISSYSNNLQQRKIEENIYGKTYGYYKGIKIQLNGYLFHILYGKEATVARQAGDVMYRLNNGILKTGYTNGTIIETIPSSENLQGTNNLTIILNDGSNKIYYIHKQYRWLSYTYHSPPITTIVSPSPNSNIMGNLSITIHYDLPEYNETYNIQFFIRKFFGEWMWIASHTILENETEETATIIIDTNKTIDGIKWLPDSEAYQILVYINDGYHIYRTTSEYFTINNNGPIVQILSPTFNERRSSNLQFKGNITIYGNSILSRVWVYFNYDSSERYELIQITSQAYQGYSIYYFSINLILNQLPIGTNIICFEAQDQYGRRGFHTIEFIKDTENKVIIENKRPTIPNPYEDTIIYYTPFDDYKTVTVFLSFSETYGSTGTRLYGIFSNDTINGTINLGKLKVGTYKIIIIAEDEAGNLASSELKIMVTESGALKTITEKISNLFILFGGLFSIVASRKIYTSKIKVKKEIVCNIPFFSKFKYCKGDDFKNEI